MKIEMVLPSLEAAGMETVVVELAIRLASRGFDVGVTCIYAEGPLRSRLDHAGIRVSWIPLPGFRSNVLPNAMTRHLRAIAPTVVHSHSGAWLKASLAANRAGVQSIVHTVHGLHDTERIKDLALMWVGALFTDAIIAVSEPLRQYLESRVRVPVRKLTTVLNGVDGERFSPAGRRAGLRERLGLPRDAFLIGNVARFAPVKDHETLLEAFALLRSNRSHCHLVLVGDGELREEIEALRKHLGLLDCVHLVGVLDDPAPAYRDFDLFVLSSVAEGTSMSVLEALASGVPVVATDVGGNGDLLGRGAHGALAPAKSPQALAESMRTLVDNSGLRERFRGMGLLFVRANLTLDRMLDQHILLYEVAANKPRPFFAKSRPV